jgi:hypothetical protein
MIEKYVFGGQFNPVQAMCFDKRFEMDGMEITILQGTFSVEIKNPTIALEEAMTKVKSRMDNIADSYGYETGQFIEAEIKNAVSHEKRTNGGKLIKANMEERVNLSDKVQYMIKSGAMFVKSEEISFDKSLSRLRGPTDDKLSLALHFYNRALQNKQDPLSDLSKSKEAIESSGVMDSLTFSRNDKKRFGKLCNKEPLHESRHAKCINSIEELRELSLEERDFCFRFVRELIEEYERYLRTT